MKLLKRYKNLILSCFLIFIVTLVFFKRKNHDNLWYLRDFKYVLKENFKTIPNYLSSKEVKEDTLFMSFDPIEWKRLKLDYNSLNELGRTIKLSNNYCNVRYTEQGKLLQGKVRLKGQMSFHWEDIDRLSFKVNLKKKGPLLGMSQFSLHHPRARNYMNEYVYYKLLDHHNLMTLNFFYLRLILNNENKGIYNVEEIPGKEFVERNGYRESVVFKSAGTNNDSIKLLYNPKLGNDAEKAQKLFSGFIKKEIKASKVFNVKALSKLFAISDLIGFYHSLSLRNIMFYFNQITGLIEPIGHDNKYIIPIKDLVVNHEKYDDFNIECKDIWVNELFKDTLFKNEYYKALFEMSEESYLDDFWNAYAEDIDLQQKILYKSYPTRSFRNKEVLESNRKFIKDNLTINEPLKNEIQISDFFSKEASVISCKNFSDTLIISKDTTINKPLILMDVPLLIKKGVVINLVDSAFILSYSKILIRGTNSNIVQIQSSDSTSCGVHLIGDNSSVYKHVRFDNLGAPNFIFWKLSGGVTLYKGDLELNNVIFANNRSEDALNTFSSTFVMDSCRFENIQSDAFDSDFSKGSVINSSFYKIGNDGIDASGSQIFVKNIYINYVEDKAISAGEKTNIAAENVNISNVSLAINSKDLSIVNIKNSRISNSDVAYVAFRKKKEYGSAAINADRVVVSDSKNLYLIENKSSLKIDQEEFGIRTKKVKDLLYGFQYGKKSIKQ